MSTGSPWAEPPHNFHSAQCCVVLTLIHTCILISSDSRLSEKSQQKVERDTRRDTRRDRGHLPGSYTDCRVPQSSQMLPGYPAGWLLCALPYVPSTRTLQSRGHLPLQCRNQEVSVTCQHVSLLTQTQLAVVARAWACVRMKGGGLGCARVWKLG